MLSYEEWRWVKGIYKVKMGGRSFLTWEKFASCSFFYLGMGNITDVWYHTPTFSSK